MDEGDNSTIISLRDRLLQLVEVEQLSKDVKAIIEYLKNNFDIFVTFLQNLDEERRGDELVEKVVKEIREFADTVKKNYVDSFFLLPNNTFNGNVFHFKVKVDEKLRVEIKRITTSINKIKEIYNNGGGERNSSQESLRTNMLIHETSFVIDLLKRRNNKSCEVVSIIGKSGLGKTNLAREIYDHKEIKNFFPSRAWGHVSDDDYSVKKLLMEILECLLPTTISENEKEMKKKVEKSLMGKKYLVLDNIRKTQEWDDIKEMFPYDNNGSRILIISREKEVGLYIGTSLFYLPLSNGSDSHRPSTSSRTPLTARSQSAELEAEMKKQSKLMEENKKMLKGICDRLKSQGHGGSSTSTASRKLKAKMDQQSELMKEINKMLKGHLGLID